MTEPADVVLRRYDGEAVRADEALRDQIAEVYADAFSAPPYDATPERARQWVADGLLRHTGYPAFGLVTAERGGRVLGFGYGQLGAEDQWFTRTVRSRVPADVAERWLGGHGELVELAVRAETRGEGVGGRLHDAVVHDLAHAGARTGLLAATVGAAPARGLYLARGWQDIARFGEHTVLMGRRFDPPGRG